ncbi:hypothetical protein Psuf_080530 [Phytohabitans suffuscus]|uniref:Uncharacterized protein n=1 Tax=Phytohabitans suffuscus TaxID=624315 RepID=A0A6F8YX52_9ACTN|nr:hypothetical protein Psuf_080530 [Phytohabitans suffuscus]
MPSTRPTVSTTAAVWVSRWVSTPPTTFAGAVWGVIVGIVVLSSWLGQGAARTSRTNADKTETGPLARLL